MSSRALLSVVVLSAAVWLQDDRPPDPLAGNRDLATLVPEHALVYVEAPSAAAVLAEGLEHPLAKALLASDFGAALARGLGQSPKDALKKLDAFAGIAVLPTLAAMGEHGFALGVSYEHGDPLSLLIARGADAAKQREQLANVFEVVATKFGFPGAFEEPGDEIDGADVWYVGDELKIALRDSVVFAANDGKLLRAALKLAAKADARGLAGDETFADAAPARDSHHLLWAWANFDELATKANGDGMQKLRAMRSEPAAQFLLGPGVSALGSGGAATLSLDLHGEDVALELRATDVELGAAAAVMPKSGKVIDFAARENDVASIAVYRDAAGLFAHRVDLFPAEQLPAFAKAASDLAPFFGGRDFSEAILPHVSPWARVVARSVEFEAGARPEIPLPAAAIVLELDDDPKIAPVLTAAFQSAIGLINVDRGQKGLDALLMQLELVDGVPMTSARFTPPSAGDGVDIRYNLVPACTFYDHSFIVGTHATLVADLVRELKSGSSRIAANGESAHIAGRAVADVVRANFEAMAANAVLNEGKSRAQAENELRTLMGLLEAIATADVRVEYPSASEVRVRLNLDLVAARD